MARRVSRPTAFRVTDRLEAFGEEGRGGVGVRVGTSCLGAHAVFILCQSGAEADGVVLNGIVIRLSKKAASAT